MSTRTEASYCRICMGLCGTLVTIEDDKITSIRGDKDDPNTMGFTCFKGLRATEMHNDPNRLTHPLKRQPDGSFVKIDIEVALDEIAAKMSQILKDHGPDAIGAYKGGGALFNAPVAMMTNEWLETIGSHKAFSAATMDQSAKFVAAGRIGTWGAGKIPAGRADIMMLIGSNPMVSVAPPFDTRNPVKRMKEARARGMELIVLDPRKTETAQFADLVIQPLPGEDAAIISGIIRIMLDEKWYDVDFCERHVSQLDALREVVDPFTPNYVARRADIPADVLRQVAFMLGGTRKRVIVGSATGPDMGPHSNATEHLIEALNTICGGFIREGEEIANPGVTHPRYPRPAQVMPAARWWDDGFKSRIDGSGMMGREMMAGVLADEILVPGEGQIRALIVHGSNPGATIPDQRKMFDALRSLELLISIQPTMTQTSRVASYIIPTKMMYERQDIPLWIYDYIVYTEGAYTRYTPPLVPTPPNSQIIDDWYVYWGLCKRMGLTMTIQGEPVSMETPPETDELIAIILRHAKMSFEEIKSHKLGTLVDDTPQYAEPAAEGWEGRFTLMPDDVREEVAAILADDDGGQSRYRLAVRRLREVMNSDMHGLPITRDRLTNNLAYMNPEDMADEGLSPGDEAEFTAKNGTIVAEVSSDASLRRGVISISHGFGGLPEEATREDYRHRGVSTNLLLNDRERQTINAMPQLSAVKLSVRRLEPA